jgi:DNA-directed RNA polymerase specialized sigma24 family protein
MITSDDINILTEGYLRSLRRSAKSMMARYWKYTYLDADDLVQEVLLARWAMKKKTKASFIMFNAIRDTFALRGELVNFVSSKEIERLPDQSNVDKALDWCLIFNLTENKNAVKAAMMYLEGYSYREIGAALQLSDSAVYGLIFETIKNNVCPDSRGNKYRNKKRQELSLMMTLREQGLSYAKIAKIVGHTQKTVMTILKKNRDTKTNRRFTKDHKTP